MVVQLLVLIHVEVVNLLVIVGVKLLVLIHVKVVMVLVLKVTIHVVVVLVVQGIVMANYLNNIVSYKFGSQCIYYSYDI